MNSVSLFLAIPEQKKSLNERQELLKELIEVVNNERKGTKFKPMSPRVFAIKLGHIPTNHLYFLTSVCRDMKKRGKNFSKYLFWAIKPQEGLANKSRW